MGLADDIINGTYRKKKKDDEEEKKSVNKTTSNSSTTKSSLADSIINKTFNEEDYFSKSRRKEKEEKKEEEQEKEQKQEKIETSSNTEPKTSDISKNEQSNVDDSIDPRERERLRIEQQRKEIEKNRPVNAYMDENGNIYDSSDPNAPHPREMGDFKVGTAQYVDGKLQNFKETVYTPSEGPVVVGNGNPKNFAGNFLKNGLLKAGSIYLDSKVDGLGSTVENAYNKIEDFSEGTKGIVGNFLMGIEGTLPKASNFITNARDYVTKKATGFVLDKAVDVISPSESESEKEFKRALTGLANDAIHNKLSETDPLTLTNKRMNSEERQKWRNETVQSNSEKARELGAVGGFLSDSAYGIGQNAIPALISFIPGGQPISAGLFMTSSGGSYLEEAEQRGMNEDEKMGYATTMGIFEGGYDWLTMGFANKALKLAGAGEILTKESAKNTIFGTLMNGFQEATTEPANEYIASMFSTENSLGERLSGKGKYANWDNMGMRMLRSGGIGMVSGIIFDGAGKNIGSAVYTHNVNQNTQQIVNKTQEQLGRELTTEETIQIQEQVKQQIKSQMMETTNLTEEEKEKIEALSKMSMEDMVLATVEDIVKSDKVDVEGIVKGVNEALETQMMATQESTNNVEDNQQLPVATGENTYSNQLKQTAIEEINNSNIPKSEKDMMLDVLNGMGAITEGDLTAIRDTIEAVKETQQLDTKGQYKNDQARRQKYVKYKNDTNIYDDSVVNEVLDMMPKNRNGRRTVKQWLQTADEIGKRISNLSNEEIERIAYKSWFDIQPSKSITQYDNVAKKQVGFQKFTSDEWINAINNAVNKARANNQTTINNKQNNISIEPIEKITSLLNEGGYRSQEQVNSLLEDIKENGIKKPIELIKNSKGEIIINDGNHRLAIAKELGLKEVPVIYLDEDIKSIKDIEKYNKELYNEASDTIKGEYNNDTNGTSKRLDSYIQRSGNIGRNNNTDNIGHENARTTRENDTIYNKEQRDNNRPSSDSTRVENSEWEKVDNKNSIKGSFLIDKIQKYLDKTGLSSKMSVDEFVNKVEKFTLENEDNMTAEQQELYDIIKDIQNRNAVKEENIDYGTNNLPKVKEGYTRLYRGLESEYDANYDKRKLDNSNGYESWTDSYELAKAYGDNVYYIDVPTSEIKDSIIDEDSTSETYGDRNLIYVHDKPVGIKGKSGSEYMLYTDHDNYSSLKYNKVEENGIEINDVLDIKNKYKDVTKYLILTEDENSISIHNMVVKEDLRNQGIGQNILDDIVEYANKKNKTITLTPTTEFNTKSRLQKWYKANGFVENKGRNTNFEISDTMYKLPEANNADAKHSLSVTDNKGRTLTKEVQEFFEDVSPEVKDENGNIKTLYHGSNSEFTVFDLSKSGQASKESKIGFWFTESEEGARKFANEVWYGDNKPTTYEVYLNLKNPKVYENRDSSQDKMSLFKETEKIKAEMRNIKEKYEYADTTLQDVIRLNNYANAYGMTLEKFMEAKDVKKEEIPGLVKAFNKYTDLQKKLRETENILDNTGYDDSYEQFKTDLYSMVGQSARDANLGGIGMSLNDYSAMEKLRNHLIEQGYDGIVIKNTRYDASSFGGNNNQYVAFYPEQIKSVKNQKPTNNPDILKEEYIQLSIEGFNREPENNLAKNNWVKYQETKKKTNEVLKREGTKVEVVKRKFSKDFVDNGYIDLNGKTINDATDVVDMAQIFRNPKYETFRVIYTKGNTIVGQEAVSSKTPNETKVYSEKSMARGLYKINNRMERLEADGYYLIHNHPTGTAKASNPDIRVTSILDDKVPGFLGHIIINSGTYALIERASNGDYVIENEININNYKADKVDEMLSKEAWANTQIKDRDDILNLAYDLKNNPNYSSLILTDAKMKPRIILDVPNKFLNMSPKQINGYVRNVARQNGANSAFLATQDIDAFNKVNILNTFQDCILYTIDDNGDLIAKKSKTKDDSSNSIFARYNSITLRANEKIEDIYNSIFETNNKRSTYNSAPTADNILATGEYTKRKTMNPTEISNLKLDNANTTPELKDRKYESGNRESSFFSNIVTDAKFLNKDLRQEMSKEDNIRYYKGITNKETLEKAYTKLQKDGQAEVLNWHSKDSKNANAEDVTEGWILLKQYQDKGDYANAVRVAKKMRDIGTTAGQTIQAYNILSRLTPEGMFYYAQSELSEAYNKMVEGKSKKWIEENQSKFDLTPEETQSIMDIMQDVATMEDGYEKKVKIAEVQKIITDKLPPSAGQSIKAWMRISMLFNTKTQVRNVAGNAVIMPVNAGSDIFASALDKLIAKKTGVRTTGTTKLKKYGKGFLKGLYESYNDFRKGINTRNIEGNRFEVSEGKSFKNKGIGKALNGLDSILSFALDAGDRGFYEATFVNSINNQLVLNKTKEVTQDMIDIATTEALQRTWQDNNAYTQSVLTIRNILNGKVGKYKGMNYGLGDVLIPFAKTPANLTKAMVDYSPAGLVKTLVTDARKFKNSLENGQYSPQLQHRLVQNLGKGMAGTVLYAVAYALAKTGIATGESDEDKDVKNFMKNSLGISSYSIKIGDKSFTYDWAQPISAPLSIMTNIVNSENKGVALLEGIVGNLDTAGGVLLEQSFMESLNEVTSDTDGPVSGIINQLLELPARAVPTFSKQIADMVDGTQRTTFEYGRPIKSAVNSIVAKVPGLSKTLPASIDTLGNEIEKYGGNNNIFNVMFNPANTNKGKLNKVGKEIYDVYNETGDKTIFPRTAPYYINNKGKKVVMDAHKRSDFQTTSGKYVQNSMNKLLKDDDYKKLDDEAKAEIINEIVSDSYAKAKYDVLKIDSKEYAKLRETLENVSSGSYYNYKFKTKDMKKDSEKMDVLINADYTEKEKTSLYEQYIVSSKDEKYPIIKETFTENGLNITKYLKYKNQDFSADRKDDGTVDGKAVYGSAKQKRKDYIESMGITYTQGIILYGLECAPSYNDKKQIVNYIKTLPNKTSKEKLEMLEKFDWITIYKDGRYSY